MNAARAQLMGEREALKQKDMSAIIAGKAAADAIKALLATSSITPLEKLDAQAVLHHAEQLLKAQRMHMDLADKIQRIDGELE